MADRVRASLGDVLPNNRLLCFMDAEDCLSLKERCGKANRGFYMPVRNGHPLWMSLPNDVRYCILYGVRPSTLPLPTRPLRAFDHLIYLHGSTCATEIGLVMCFAHELQHFVQHETAATLWASNTLVNCLPRADCVTLGLQWCDIPIEREARIVSRRIAEELLGAEPVRRHIRAKIDECVTEEDAADWKCIRDLDVSSPYDLAFETKRLFTRLRQQRSHLEIALADLSRHDPDFRNVDLETLLGAFPDLLV